MEQSLAFLDCKELARCFAVMEECHLGVELTLSATTPGASFECHYAIDGQARRLKMNGTAQGTDEERTQPQGRQSQGQQGFLS
mmetsp:Transcript_3053/g.10013  ORF Transcript_3053/g.10013 Transcript_3053/m.10013 type:complete len:83 (+) Transcript_3053:104-352(+)